MKIFIFRFVTLWIRGNKLTFKATDFEARSDVAYRVKLQAIRTVRFGVLTSIITAEKTITVTVTDLDDEAPTIFVGSKINYFSYFF
jgi:hypothetical protein